MQLSSANYDGNSFNTIRLFVIILGVASVEVDSQLRIDPHWPCYND